MKAGSKFEKGGDKLKSIHVHLETWTQLGIDLITNLPKTEEGYNTILTCIDYTSKLVESKTLKGKLLKVLPNSCMSLCVILELLEFIFPTREGNLSMKCVHIPVCT